uniref:Nucleoprotein n=1 Tax=Hymenopteran rhabdo-related virus OKIAV8 TaxID=2746296 RepID=A0A7D7F343_9RHAB|nr:nucleocapsid protein [Hymenopteran rhabdo-related virus OKIAV8]
MSFNQAPNQPILNQSTSRGLQNNTTVVVATDGPTFTRQTTGATVAVQTPQVTVASQYPSEWFEVNRDKKPQLVIPRFRAEGQALSLAVLAGAAAYGIKHSNLSINIAKRFLYDYFQLDPIKSPSAWTSFNVLIAEQDEDVTPWSLVMVSEIDMSSSNMQTTDSVTDSDLQWIACVLLAPARLLKVSNESYYTLLRDRIFAQAKTYGMSGYSFPSKSMYEGWDLDDNYLKMVAAIDMTLYNFPNHPHASLRLCTLGSRFKDCAALLSVGFLANFVGMKSESLILDWLFTEKLADEICQMMREGQEYVKEDSYFPYQSDLRLVKKTYYSASKNPHIYFLIHAVGTLLGSMRSQNARMLCTSNLPANIVNAKVMAYAFQKNVVMTKAFISSDAPVPDDEDVIPTGDDLPGGGLPLSTNGSEWFEVIHALKFQLPEEIDEFIAVAKSKITDPRADSIGKYVKDHF